MLPSITRDRDTKNDRLQQSLGAKNFAMSSSHGGQKDGGGLNATLDTSYIDVSPEETSIVATITRAVANAVGKCCKPKQMLVVLRLLKAITFCFLVLSVAADTMYIIFVEFVAGSDVGDKLGGFRDTTIRIYGLGLAVMAIFVELDVSVALRHFSGLKAFLPRSLLLFFIATITNAHPLHQVQASGFDDDQVVVDDDDSLTSAQIPNSAIIFQMTTSIVVAICAAVYFVLGLLCFDRFTSKAFLSSNDPRISTAIPQPLPSQTLPGQSELAETQYDPPTSV